VAAKVAAFCHLEKTGKRGTIMSSSPNISVKPEYSEQELREKAAAFDKRFGNNAYEFLNGREQQIEAQTYRLSAKTTDGKEIEQTVAASNLDVAARQGWDVIKERDQAGVQIASARLEWDSKQGGPQVEYLYDRKQGIETYRPEGITLSNERVLDRGDEQRQEFRGDWQRRQEWNGLIEGGSVSTNQQERSIQELKPPNELTRQEIVTEARELHAHFSEMMTRYETMQPGPERAQLREEMKPLALRENELREEHTGRVKAEVSREVSQDRVPEVERQSMVKENSQQIREVAYETTPQGLGY
jgi:hypothetical protein